VKVFDKGRREQLRTDIAIGPETGLLDQNDALGRATGLGLLAFY
jgi:hypothetical protein